MMCKYGRDFGEKLSVGDLVRAVGALIEEGGDYRAYLENEFFTGAWDNVFGELLRKSEADNLKRDIGSLIKFAFLLGKGELSKKKKTATADTIQQLRELEKKITKGTWAVGPHENHYRVDSDHEGQQAAVAAHGLDRFTAVSVGTPKGQVAIIPLDESSKDNGEFIAFVRNHIVALLNTLEESQ
jgi:hypothetical protein